MRHRRREILAMLGAAALPLAVPRQAMAHVSLTERDVLLVVDVQNCFLPGGSLAVKDGDAVVPVINALAAACQKSANDATRPESAPPSRQHVAPRPMRRDSAAKNRPMRMKANMNLVR